MKVSYNQALKNRKHFSSYLKAKRRLIPEVKPVFHPKFTCEDEECVFTIGSCFARNIEDELFTLGYKIPTMDFRVPSSEYPNRFNGILNKYTPASIYTELEWFQSTLENNDIVGNSRKFIIRSKENKIIDSNLSGFLPVSDQRFIERRKEIFELYKKIIDAQTVTITLGLIEAWYDLENECYIQQMPLPKALSEKIDGDKRFELRELDFKKSYHFIAESIKIIRELNKDVKILITTSPVPMSTTFIGKDILSQNCYSKSLLRTVAEEISRTYDQMDYFPSYEMVTLSKENYNQVWKEDLIHVQEAFVSKIVNKLIDSYFPSIPLHKKNYQTAMMYFKNNELEKAKVLIEENLVKFPKAPQYKKLLNKINEASEKKIA